MNSRGGWPRLLLPTALLVRLAFLPVGCAAGPPKKAVTAGDSRGAESLLPEGLDSRRMEIGGRSIRYLISSTASYRGTLLCIHGLGGTAMDFALLAEELAPAIRVVAPDLPGTGRSDGAEDYSMALYQGVVDAFTEFFAPEAIAGHSLGAKVVLVHAYRHREQRRPLVLLAPFGLEGEEGRFLGRLARCRFLVRLGTRLNNRGAIRRNAERKVYFDPRAIDERVFDAQVRSQLSREGRRALAEVTTHIVAGEPVGPLLPEIDRPVMIVWGENDQVLSPEWAPRFLGSLPDARLVIIPRCGHDLMVERAGPVGRVVGEFLVGALSPVR